MKLNKKNNQSNYSKTFIKSIIGKSNSEAWSEAVKEWCVSRLEDIPSLTESCICGKPEIRYCYEIKNQKNSHIIYPIGSSCIKKFGRDDFVKIDESYIGLLKLAEKLKNNEFIKFNKENGFSRKLIDYMYKKGVFKSNNNDYKGTQEGERDFLIKMFNKRNEPSKPEQSKINAIIKFNIIPFLGDLIESDEKSKNRRTIKIEFT